MATWPPVTLRSYRSISACSRCRIRWSRTATLFFSSWNIPASSSIRQPLDVTQQEQGCVIALEGGDGAPEPLLQQRRGLDGGMRRPVVIDRLGMNRPAAQQVYGRVDGRAPEVGRRQRSGLNLSAAGQDAEKNGLQDVLGVGRVPGDAQGRAEHRLVVALVQLGKPNQGSRGSHDGRLLVGNLLAGCVHVARLTSLDAPGGRLLHGVREN